MTLEEMREIAKAQYAAHRVWRRMNPTTHFWTELVCFPEGVKGAVMLRKLLDAYVKTLHKPGYKVKVSVYRGKTGQFNKDVVQADAELYGMAGRKNGPLSAYAMCECDECGRQERVLFSALTDDGGYRHSRRVGIQKCAGVFRPLRKDRGSK